MKALRLALDWTPNINHIGFFVAQEKGFYRDHDLAVTITDPSTDNYRITPAKKVELDEADLALCPTESIISYRTKVQPFDLLGIATIFQEDLSAIAVKPETAATPKELDGKSYASYQARYEDGIVRQMMRNDGGAGTLKIDYPAKLGIWETLLNGTFDSTWIFTNWEGVDAESQGIPLRLFRMNDYGIPYSYSPMLAVSQKQAQADEARYRQFLAASRRGFLYAKEQPEEAVSILKPLVPEHDQHIDLHRALALSVPAFGDANTWGLMDAAKVQEFLQWIYDHQLEPQQLKVGELMTNDLL